MTVDPTLLEMLRTGVAAGSAVVGGSLAVFSVMVLPALDRIPAGTAVGVFQQVNEVAVRPPFLLPFLAVPAAAAVTGVLVLLARDDHWGWHLVGCGLVVGTLLITGVANVRANTALALIDPGEPGAAAAAWATFGRAWRPANAARVVTALAGAVLLLGG